MKKKTKSKKKNATPTNKAHNAKKAKEEKNKMQCLKLCWPKFSYVSSSQYMDLLFSLALLREYTDHKIHFVCAFYFFFSFCYFSFFRNRCLSILVYTISTLHIFLCLLLTISYANVVWCLCVLMNFVFSRRNAHQAQFLLSLVSISSLFFLR